MAVFMLGFLLYANTIGHQYAQDDAIVLTENQFTQQGFAGLKGIFTHDTFFGFFQDTSKARLVSGGRYRPLSVATFAVEYGLFGESPMISHLLNALLYGLCGLLVFVVLQQLLHHFPALERQWMALAAALLFVAHPVHTEAVANIKGRDEILAMLGAMAALYGSMRAIGSEKMRWVWHTIGAFCLFLGMMSKENAFVFVGIIPLAWYVFARQRVHQLVVPALPYLMVGVLFLWIRASVLPPGGSGPSLELMNNPFLRWENSQYVPLTFAERLPTVLYTWGRYLGLLFAPLTLTHDYYPRHIDLQDWGSPLALFSGVVFGALIVYGVWASWNRKALGFAVVFFLITFLPVSNLLFPIGTNMAERLLFMPSFGWAFALPLLAVALVRGRSQKQRITWAGLRAISLVLVAYLVFFSARTILRNPVWKDNYTLFTTDIAVSHESAKLRNAVGGELVTQSIEQDDPQRKEQMLREAVGHLEQATRIHPRYKNAYLLQGNAHNYLEQYEASIAAYRQALAIDPEYADARRNLAITLRQAGQYFGEKRGDLQRSIQYLREANQIQPGEYEVLRLLGVAHGQGGMHQQAVAFFRQALEVRPGDAQAWFNLGIAQQLAGQPEQAAQSFARAREIDPQVEQKMNANR